MVRRMALVAFLVYVALDLSLPAMPGAFVFDPAGSVDSIEVSRPGTERLITTAPLARHISLMERQLDGGVSEELTPTVASRTPVRPLMSQLPRAALGPPPPSEDPH
jgi:hypothetical protein